MIDMATPTASGGTLAGRLRLDQNGSAASYRILSEALP